MTARNQNPPRPIASGDSFTLAFPIEIVGEPISLSGAACTWGLYVDTRDGAQKLAKTLESGVRMTQAAGVWTLHVDVAPGETATFSGDYYHEATIVVGEDLRSTIASGVITFRPTRNP